MDAHLIGEITFLLMIACAVAIIAEWLKQPYTIALVLVGLVVAVLNLTPHIIISHDIIFTLILPPLLFHGALHMDLSHLKENWRSIVLLAFPGVVITTLLIGLLAHHFLHIPFIYAMLFGAIVTPTDPISVLSILGRVGAPKRLRTILEGESLFNDGTGVVVFMIILEMIHSHAQFDLGHALTKFLMVTGGGTVIGIAVGVGAYHLLKRLDDHLLEVAITVVITFGTPLLAEAFHFSGIIAIVVTGMIIGNYGKIYSMSNKTRETLDSFWEVIEFVINSLLFLIIGLELQEIPQDHLRSLGMPIVIAILAVNAARGLVVYPVIWLRNKFGTNDIPWKWKHVLFWGGLKGSISIALVVGLPAEMPYRETFLVLAFGVVLFTLIVQGLTMKPLIQSLRLNETA
ncbi:MAG: Na+/H+ antiporter [Candidatus Omnitrophica bacterium]|nr:Na+/H+ antiporter [Candidatus Omnitrophota bacterium]MCB9721092.1 Na+/H+ antiporter [Candidatus Omnitrophota bacterium]